MENQNYNDWVKTNPGKNINDYYALSRKKLVTDTKPVIQENGNMLSPTNTSLTPNLPQVINIRLSALRVFIYTGIVMISSIIWGFLIMILLIVLLGSGQPIKDAFLAFFETILKL